MLYRICFFLLIIIVVPAAGQQAPLSSRIANYDMEIRLDTEAKKIYGEQTLLWRNPSGDTIRELQYHLYLNAFRNSESTFMKERGIPDLLADPLINGCEWAWIDVEKITDQDGNDLTNAMQYIHPDDDNEADRTVISVPLTKPVLPHDSIRVKMKWTTRIPRTMVRTGYNRDYYFMAQWFPKVGVYEPAGMRYATEGKWNCHQYHSKGEYYSNFGVYNVILNVPESYIVGSSGIILNEAIKDGRKIVQTRAEDVIDYTWTASPHFRERKEVRNGVVMRLLYYPEHERFADRYFASIRNSLEYLGEHLMEYPYPQLTIVDPPYHGLFTVGMEYPMLITVGSLCFLPEGIKTTETLAVHEFIHQYFMQMVATHEQEEPWMDEGITTYYEGRIMDHYYGEKTSTIDVLGVTAGNKEFNRIEFFASGNERMAPNVTYSRNFKHGGYGDISYNKVAIWLETLEGIVGVKTVDEIMKTYFNRWKFNHPCRMDFLEIANEVIRKNHGDKFGENMDWFFDQVLYGTEICDYKVGRIRNELVEKPIGVFDKVGDCIQPDEETTQEDVFASSVVLLRDGDIKLPQEILVKFDDGSNVLEVWDGMSKTKEFNYKGTRKIVSVEIDPERKIWMDKNFLNNSRSVKPQKTGVRKYVIQFMFWIQNAMETLNLLV